MDYVITYTAIARNVSADALATALGGVPRDTAYEATLGLVALTDVTVSFSKLYARRSISYTRGPNAIAPDPELGAFLTNLYTSKFGKAISTPVIASPVVNVPTPTQPVLWVNAQFGAALDSSGNVEDWADMSGNTADLLQTSPTDRPIFVPSAIADDVAAVRFATGAKFLQSAAPLVFDEFTYLLTTKTPLTSTPGLLFERSVDATAHSGEHLYQSQGAPEHSILARRSAVVHSADAGVDWAITGNYQMLAYTYSHANGGALFINGVQVATFTPLGAESVSATLYVGARASAALPVDADMREIFVFDRELTDPELGAMAAYMDPQVGL